MVENMSYVLQVHGSGAPSFELCESATTPTTSDSRVEVARGERITVRYVGTKFYARPTEINNNLVVVDILPGGSFGQEIFDVDKYGSVEVVKQDQFTEVIDLLLRRQLDTITLLSNEIIGNLFIDIETTGVVPAVGDYICLKEDQAFYQGQVLTVTPISGNQYTVKLDSPLDYAFTTAGGCSLDSVEMNVNGSVTPVIFSVSPVDTTGDWDIIRMVFSMTGIGPPENPAPDDTLFGTLTALTNGIVVRTVDGTYKNIFNAKTNANLKLRCGGDLIYTPANRTGSYGISARRTFNGDDKNGVTLRLTSAGADEFQVIVQDDLRDLESFRVCVQGHVVT